MKTHYDVLGVPFGADFETIRAAYRKALKAYHPDLHEGNAAAELISKKIIDAYAALKHPEQRAQYDEYVLRRRQRHRLVLITAILSAGLACGGSLALLQISPALKATAVASSDVSVAEKDPILAPPNEAERVAEIEPSPAPAAPLAGNDAALAPVIPDEMPALEVAEPARQLAAVAPADEVVAMPSGPQETIWHSVAKRGNVQEIWRFAQQYSGAPEATLAEERLGELIETNEDVASLEELRAVAIGPTALKVQARLDMLTAPREITGALPETDVAQLKLEIEPQDEASPAPEPVASPAPEPVASPEPDAVASPAPGTAEPEPEAVDQTAHITPRDPKKHFKKGQTLLKAGKHDEAIASFSNAILLDGSNADFYLTRAAAWETRNDPGKALADYDAATRLTPANIATFHARGLFWRRRGDFQRALADLDRAIRLSFSDAKIYRDRGAVWYDMGRTNRAIADFNHAISLDPNLASAYVSRGQAFHKKGDLVTADINFEKAARRDPAAAKASRDLYLARSEKEEAARKEPQASR